MTTPKTPRTKAVRPIADLSHVDGCPAERIEAFSNTDPAGDTVKVTRCLDCASATYERE